MPANPAGRAAYSGQSYADLAAILAGIQAGVGRMGRTLSGDPATMAEAYARIEPRPLQALEGGSALVQQFGGPGALAGLENLGMVAPFASGAIDTGASMQASTQDARRALEALEQGNLGQGALDSLSSLYNATAAVSVLPAWQRGRAMMAPDAGGGSGGGMPTTPAPTRAPTGRGRQGTMAGVPNLREMGSFDEVLAAARQEPHLIQGRDGQFVGAPRGARNIGDIARLRSGFDEMVALGARGGPWYDEGRNTVREIAGSDPRRQSLAAGEMGHWSPQANPDTNYGFMTRGHNQYELTGQTPDVVRTGAQARRYQAAREAAVPGSNQPGGEIPQGAKTGVYTQHLDPTKPQALTGTNDIWHARAWGFTNPDGKEFSRALTTQEHTWLDYETTLAVDRANAMQLGGRSNWTAAQVQAAAWVGAKGRALHLRNPKRYPTLEAGIAEAAKGYPQALSKYTMNVPYESVPYGPSGLMTNIAEADYGTREAFHNAAPWTNEDGQDTLFADTLGLWTRRTNEGPGYWTGEGGEPKINPASVARPQIDTVPANTLPGGGSGRALNPVTQQAVKTGNMVRGYMDMQGGVGGNLFFRGSGGEFKLFMGRRPNESEMQQLGQIAQQHGYTLANTEDGVAFLEFSGRRPPRGFEQDVRAAFPGMDLARGRFNKDTYADLSSQLAFGNAGQGQATMALIGELNQLRQVAPRAYENMLDSAGISGHARANLDRVMTFGGQGQRPDYETAMSIIGEGGLRRLLQHVRRHGAAGLPALGALALLPQFQEEDPSRP